MVFQVSVLLLNGEQLRCWEMMFWGVRLPGSYLLFSDYPLIEEDNSLNSIFEMTMIRYKKSIFNRDPDETISFYQIPVI